MATRRLHRQTHITVLEGLEPVRSRPGMYIGGTDTKGYHHLLWEIVDNSVDEVINGYATRIEVTLHKDGKSVTVDRQRPRHPRRHQEAVQEVGARAGADHAARGRQVLVGAVPVLGRPARRRLVGGERAVGRAGRRRSSATAPSGSRRYERGKAPASCKKVGAGARHRHDDHFRPDPRDLRQAAASTPRRSASAWTPRRSCTRA